MKLFFSLVFLLFWLVRNVEVTLPFDHSDPLYYHLAGAKIALEHSFLTLKLHLPSYAQAGYFDLSYFLFYVLNLSPLKTQIISQWWHFIWSMGFASFTMLLFFKRSFWAILGAILMLTLAKESAYFLYAKNDGFLAALSLLAAILVIEKKSWWWIAIVFGLLAATKLSGLYVVIPLVMIWLYDHRDWKLTLKAAMLAFLIWLPKLLFSYFMIKNPLFPGFLNLFPGDLTPSMLSYNQIFFGAKLKLSHLAPLLGDLFLGKVIFLAAPVIFIFNYLKNNHRSNLYFLVALSIFSLYVISNGAYRAPRFFFGAYFILGFFIIKSLVEMKIENHIKWAPWVFLVLLLIDSKIDKSLSHAKKSLINHLTLSEHEIIRKEIPHTRFWDYLNKTDENQFIISDYIAETFYLPKNTFLDIPDHSPLAHFLNDCDDEKRLSNYHYALISKPIDNACYRYIKQFGTKLYYQEGITLYSLPPKAGTL